MRLIFAYESGGGDRTGELTFSCYRSILSVTFDSPMLHNVIVKPTEIDESII